MIHFNRVCERIRSKSRLLVSIALYPTLMIFSIIKPNETNVIGIELLKKPRRVILLVQAETAVDDFIVKLVMKTLILMFVHIRFLCLASITRTMRYHHHRLRHKEK